MLPDIVYKTRPKIAVVIGTFASVPYVHLHLELLKRNNPEVPVMVHDDCSPRGA